MKKSTVDKSNIAYKFRIYPNSDQKVLIEKTFGCVRFIYNKMLGDKIEFYKKTKQMLNTTPARYKSEFVWLKEVDSLALANAQLHLQSAYTNFFNNPKSGFPTFKSKRSTRQSYTTNNQKNNIRLEGNCIKLPKVGLVKIRQHRTIPESYTLKSVTVSKTSGEKYFVSILFEYENQVKKQNLQKFLGLDFSMHELYVASDGSRPEYPRYYRKSEKKLAKEQRKLSHMQKGSNNYKKQRVKIARLCEHTANQRKDFLHKQSRILVGQNDCICIESLNMRAVSKSLNFGKSVHDNGWGMFTCFLDYKLKAQGKRLIKIDKYFASSQLCSVCGYQNKETKDLSVREWTCPKCKTHHDRDVNAAVNIRNEGMHLVNA